MRWTRWWRSRPGSDGRFASPPRTWSARDAAPASGSHATYYDEALYLGTGQNGSGFGCDNTTGPSRRVAPEPVVVPSSDDAAGAFAWLSYEGKWGPYVPGLNNGPDGPAPHARGREPAP